MKTKTANTIVLDDLWNPAFNTVWNRIAPFVIGKDKRGDIPPCSFDELFLQGGRACVDGDTLISTPNGDVKIKDFNGGEIYCYDKNGNILKAIACSSTKYQEEELFEVTTDSDRKISVTSEHKFLTSRGWIPCGELTSSDLLVELNCSCDIQPSDFLRKETIFSSLQASYYGGHLSRSHEDAVRLSRTILSLIYRCSRDFHLCDEQLLMESDTFQDVLQLLCDGQRHTHCDSHTDDQDDERINIHSFLRERLHSSSHYPNLTVDRYCEDLETEICEMISGLISEICSVSSQCQKIEDLRDKVEQVSRLVLGSTCSSCSQNEHLKESHILQTLSDMLLCSIADNSYSDYIANYDCVMRNRHKYITYHKIVSIRSIGKREFYDIFVPFYNNYIGNGIVNHNSGKSYFASVIVWLSLENDIQKNAVIIRKVGSSLRKSCWKQMMKVRERLELFHWKPNKTELTFTNENTGQQIFFLGLDDEEKARSITVEKGYLSIAWFEEAKQFRDMEEIDQAVSSILRGGDDGEEDGCVKGDDCDEEDFGKMEYMTILTYNPPKSQFDWINHEAKIGVSKPNRMTHKSTYLTMPKKWLGRKVLNEIASMKERKPVQYEHMYLGKITGTGGEYFKNVTIREITDDEIANFDYFNMGIDWGFNDPNVFLKTYVHDGKLYIFDEIYQDEIPQEGNKYVEFARLVKAHTRDCPNDTIYCDAQDKGGMAVFKMPQFDIPIEEAPKQGANDRKNGYGYLQGLDEIVIDPKRCPHCAVAFPMFESAIAPGGNGWLDAPGNKNDHCPDCVRYSEWENIQNNSRNDDEDSAIFGCDIGDDLGEMDDDDEDSTFGVDFDWDE